MANIRFKALENFISEECILSRSRMNKYYLLFLFVVLAALFGGCKKDATVSSDSLYTPTLANVHCQCNITGITGRPYIVYK